VLTPNEQSPLSNCTFSWNGNLRCPSRAFSREDVSRGAAGKHRESTNKGIGGAEISHGRPSSGLDPSRCVTQSITSSARARSVGGTSRPSAFAVLRLSTVSHLVGACSAFSTVFGKVPLP
jgi:hypothetical protein